jgi:hypothetical protein
MTIPTPGTAPTQQALYRSLMKEAAAQGRVLMQRMVRRAALAMPQKAALVREEEERKLLAESARTLGKHETALCESYPHALLAEFAHAISGDTRKPSALSFDSLELMGDEQMQESVDFMRVQQAVALAVEAELAELNSLVCAVQGLRSVQAERNPLRPDVYVRSLRSVVMQSPVPQGVRKRWVQNLGEAMGPELAAVYRDLCNFLYSHGVTGAGFNIVPSAESVVPPRASAASSLSGLSQAGTLLNVKELRRLLSGELDGPAASGGEGAQPGADFSMTMPAALEALQELKQVDQVVTRLKRRLAQRPDSDAGRDEQERLRLRAQGPGQALALEVVNLMIENIAGDPRLLAPVQQAVRDLEPALLRLALGDPRFFSDRRHPARRLLEQMTQRSLAWHAADAPGFAAFLEPLQQAVDVLVSTRVEGAEPFDFALKSLEEAWGDLEQRDRHHREKAVRALLQAEQRNLLAAKIAKELRERTDVAAAPREVMTFVLGPWSQVMAQARLADDSGSSDPGGYGAVVGDLVWSTQPRAGTAHAARLSKRVPLIVEKLRHGLATIDYPAAATQRFLDFLAQAHGMPVSAAQEPGRPPAVSTSMSREDVEALFAEDDQDSATWLAPQEAQQSGFVETHQSLSPKPLFQQTQPAALDTQPGEIGQVLPDASLRPGTWVEMLGGAGWGRHQVTWASPHGTLFMFANASGETHSMTRRLLDKMLRAGTLRMVASQAVVDGALDAVAQAALANSLGLKS